MTENTFVHIQTQCEAARNRCGQLRRQVGATVCRARRDRGWSRGAVGRQLGLTSARGISRFGARLASIERGETVPTAEEMTRWNTVLPLDTVRIRADLGQLRQEAQELVRWEAKERTFWIEYLAASVRSGDIQTGAWHREPVPGSGFYLFTGPLRFGHGPLTRGQLVALWKHQQGYTQCPECGGRLGLFFGARGLSRIHRISGVCLDHDCGVTKSVSGETDSDTKARMTWITNYFGRPTP